MNTNTSKTLPWLAALMSVWVVFVSAYLCYLTPKRPWPYLVAIALVAAAWTVRAFAQRTSAVNPRVCNELHKITQAIVLSAALLGVLATLALLTRLGWITSLGGELDARVGGVMMGFIVVAMANGIPKQISSARGLAVLRMAGWGFVLGGLGYALCWLLLPLTYAGDVAIAILLWAMAYVALRMVWVRSKHRPALPPT